MATRHLSMSFLMASSEASNSDLVSMASSTRATHAHKMCYTVTVSWCSFLCIQSSHHSKHIWATHTHTGSHTHTHTHTGVHTHTHTHTQATHRSDRRAGP